MSFATATSLDSGHLRRAVALTAVIALHVAMILGLTRWTALRTEAQIAAPLEVLLLAESAVPDEPPPVQLPPLIRVDPVLPDLPVIEIADPPAPSPNAITVAMRPEPEPPVQHTAPGPVVISQAAYVREPRPFYPPASRREHEHGLVVLKVLIGVDGSAVRVEIQDSSGYERLDHAAREAVLRALFRPYVENGIARPAVVLVPIEFELNTRLVQSSSNRDQRGARTEELLSEISQ